MALWLLFPCKHCNHLDLSLPIKAIICAVARVLVCRSGRPFIHIYMPHKLNNRERGITHRRGCHPGLHAIATCQMSHSPCPISAVSKSLLTKTDLTSHASLDRSSWQVSIRDFFPSGQLLVRSSHLHFDVNCRFPLWMRDISFYQRQQMGTVSRFPTFSRKCSAIFYFTAEDA